MIDFSLHGTFGLLLIPCAATGLLMISAVSTPVLAALAIWFVARWRALTSVIAVAAVMASALAARSIGLAGGASSRRWHALRSVQRSRR